MVICGQTFDFSPLNANDIERLETANEKMQRAGESELEQFRRGGVRICDHMRAQARLVMNCLDEVRVPVRPTVWAWTRTTPRPFTTR